MSRWRRPERQATTDRSFIQSCRTRLALGALQDRFPEVRRIHHAIFRAGGDSDRFEDIVAAWYEYQVDYVRPVEHATEADVARLVAQLTEAFAAEIPEPSNVTRLPPRPPE